MSFKRYLGGFITRVLMLFFSVITSLVFAAYSYAEGYQLVKVAQLEHQLLSQANWQQLIVNPSNKQQYFAIRESGQLYLVDDDKVKPKAILDMKPKGSSLFKLTAIELHPNFSLRDQVGYSTFYTAHIETINTNSKTKRLEERVDDAQLSFDAVITEWRFSSVNHQRVDLETKREVLRVSVPDQSMVIKQMSFNPYIKSWNDNFGLLHIALAGGSKWSQPLYSGVILRIDPAKFGLRSFTIPDNNPYLKDTQINDAIYLLGGQGIERFIWPGKNSENILVSHKYNNKYLLSLTDGWDDWRNSASKQMLYQGDDAIHDMLMYQGRELSLLRSKLLLLRQNDQHWFIDSLTFNLSDKKSIRDEKKPQTVWQFTSQQLPINSHVLFSRDYYGELLLLDTTINVLFRLAQQVLIGESLIVDSEEEVATQTDSSDSSIFILFFILFLVILGVMYLWFIRGAHSVKSIVRQQFASFELSKSSQQIGLYHRHQDSAETIVDVVDIVSSEIKLNENRVSNINIELGHGFNNDKEQDLRTIFVKEKVDKMVDGKVRQISLLLTDKDKNCYTICLYMRKGSNRITKKHYIQVVNELIDWCWFIGEKLNPDEFTKRKIKPIPNNKVDINANKKAPLHSQAAAIRPANHQVDEDSQTLAIGEDSPNLNVVSQKKSTAELAGEHSAEEHAQMHEKNTIDTELVNALEKLVTMKQQGFLTMEEFSKAKEKLLKELLKK